MDELTHWLNNSLSDWLSDRKTDRQTETDWLAGWLADWLFHWLLLCYSICSTSNFSYHYLLSTYIHILFYLVSYTSYIDIVLNKFTIYYSLDSTGVPLCKDSSHQSWLYNHLIVLVPGTDKNCTFNFPNIIGKHGGLMVSERDSGPSGLGLSPGQGHCVVFLGKTLYSHSASLHPGV